MEYGLIGEKLGHSYSKMIHEKLADYNYEITPVAKENFAAFMEAGDFKAINVTIPYKSDVEAVLDIIYNPLKTKLLLQAEELGIKAVNGLEMLVAQAKKAVEYFLDKKIEDDVIDEIHEKILKEI